ncbi:hypothetical protein niasHS_011137 [Heterodera schachtii]|uniref:PHD-type domain-containing protein n=1 Tax=Heterodera schachtii TaxID=97005 RepID=A0ABD2J093_HETSC
MKLPISSNKFNKYELYKFRHATMAIAENIGFSTSNSSAISSLSFLLRTYFEQLCRDSLNSAINSGRAEVGLEDVSYVFGANGINITELHDYIQQVQPYAADEHPLFPVTEPLNVPPSSEIADTSERKNGERESAGNDAAEVDEEGNREQNNKHSVNSFNSRSNVRNAISQKIFPNFVGAFAPNLGFSVRRVELPTENVSVDQHLFTILPPPESAQHVIFEFDRSVAQPMRARAAISEEQERLLKKEKKKKKREKGKRMAAESEQIPLGDGKRKNHKPKDHPTESTNTPSIVSVSEDRQQNPSADTESSKMEKRILIRIPISQRTPPSVTTTNTTTIVSVSEDKQQNPSAEADNESSKMEKRILIRIPISQRTSPPVTKTTDTTPIANTTPIVSVSEDKQNSPAPLTVTSSGRSVKPSKRKFEETEPKKSMSTKAPAKAVPKAAKIMAPQKLTTPSFPANERTNNSADKVKAEEKTEPKKAMATKAPAKAVPKAAKIAAPQKMTTPSFPANDRSSNNSAEKVKAIAKAVEQIAAAHFSGTQSTKKTPAQNAVASNDGEEEEEDIWICPTCSVAYVEGQEMVACDDCDRWYHWGCVGILIPPPEKAQWYCTECRRKRKKAAQRQQTSTGGGSGSNSRKSSFSGGTPTGGATAAKKQRIAKA